MRLPFGEHQGEHIVDIAAENPGYLHWMLKELDDLDDDLREEIDHALSHGPGSGGRVTSRGRVVRKATR